MKNLTIQDLEFINDISHRVYTDNTFLSNANGVEKDHLRLIKKKLKLTTEFFKTKYDNDYGIFTTTVVTGNDIAIGGNKLKRIWSGIFKGNSNKQYSAQISFVINPNKKCLDVGFFFGRTHSHKIKKEDKIKLEYELKNIALSIHNKIINDKLFNDKFHELCDFGFLAYSNNQRVNFEDWNNLIIDHANTSQIVVEVYPNEIGEIELSKLDFYVSQIIFLLSSINPSDRGQSIKAMSIEQRAKQLQRLCEIGLKGEQFIFNIEYDRLKEKGLLPIHQSLISDHYGYDILSFDENGADVFIEVKTTCRLKSEYNAQKFFITNNEYNVFQNNKEKFKLIRVYDIEGSPYCEEVDLNTINLSSNGYVCEY